MYIKQVSIKNFRCFPDLSLEFHKPIILITGSNGSGKSSLLEALHYGCYLRSFRTHLPRELVHFDNDYFFIKILIEENQQEGVNHELHVGFSQKKRLIKIDQKNIASYKDLSHIYRVVTLTEEDITLIKGGPEIRRLFLDQAILLESPHLTELLRRYKKILENRNALLYKGTYTQESYRVWTSQLWEETAQIQRYRQEFLEVLQTRTQVLLEKYFEKDLSILFSYLPKRKVYQEDFEDFWESDSEIFRLEPIMKRSLFGAHLDDFSISWCQKSSRSFSSRGQQKLIILLIKIAQLQELSQKYGPCIFLLDDFMADFDQKRIELALSILFELRCQLIFTCPTQGGSLEKLLQNLGAQCIELTN